MVHVKKNNGNSEGGGGGGVVINDPSGTEILRGWGVKSKKTLCGGGGVWIFSGTTQCREMS